MTEPLPRPMVIVSGRHLHGLHSPRYYRSKARMDAITVVTFTENPDGTITPSWSPDGNPNLSDYLLSATGFSAPTRVPAAQLTLPALPNTGTYGLSVTPE